MNEDRVRGILQRLAEDNLDVEEALQELRYAPFVDLGEAKLDVQREMRTGVPEAIYAPGKTTADIVGLVEAAEARPLFVTRAGREVYEAIRQVADAVYHERARLVVIGAVRQRDDGLVAVVSAGSSDVPVAEEAAVVAASLGHRVDRVYDVGAAGLHRLLAYRDILADARGIIVTAGMDGVLPSIVASLFPAPVVGLPTSVGYGTGLDGHAALLTMLNSCSPGVAVVNIDNGYGAGVFAHKIVMQCRAGNDGPP
ncbi:MAG: nickel pincer cofactor biosynthesis protein LarB [Thermoplasmatota archaeon]